MNGVFSSVKLKNRRNPPFSRFGTGCANVLASIGMVPLEQQNGRKMMFNLSQTGSKLFAAAFSVAISAVFMATAIVPASPTLFA